MKVRGRFYFKLTDSGNLLGEYSHSTLGHNRPEAAVRRADSSQGGFDGNYLTTWLEVNGTVVKGDLLIRPIQSGVFPLEWTISGKLKFKGQGMLCDGMLLGDYEEV